MFRPRFTWAVAIGLLATAGSAADAPPRIMKPRAAPVLTDKRTPPPPAQFDEKLEIGGNAVKAKLVDTRLTVDTHVNGRGPYRFVVDSGADTSVVGLGIAHDLQLPIGTPIILNNMTARNTVDRVKVGRLSFGPSSISDLEVPALKEEDLGGQGMLGIDALVEQRLMLDFDKKLIKVEDARVRQEYFPDAITITARRQRGQLILARVRAGGVALDAVIDTGSEITVGNSALRDKLIRKGSADFVTVEVTGVTGVTQKLQVAHVPELILGPVRLRNVPIAFADLPPFQVFGLSDQPALLLGTDILETFRKVSLDFRSRKVRFQLRKCTPEDVVINLAPVAWATNISWYGEARGCVA
jgi:hypothetical protein